MTAHLGKLLFLVASIGACSPNPPPRPHDTVRDLLELHGLWGKTPEDRDEAERRKPPDALRLAPLFTDIEKEDPFLANLYVGFLAGALARHQDHLVYAAEGDTVEVRAGDVRIVMHRMGDRYRIALNKSIPRLIRQRAEAELEHLLAKSP
jgi:hypothetical protein